MIFNPWLLLFTLAAAIAVAAEGYYYGGKHADAAWKVTIAAQKLEAAQKLADVIRLNGIKEEADRQRAITNQKDYDESLKSLVDSNRKYAGQLRFSVERRGVCGDSAPSQAGTSTGTTQVVSVEVGIPNEIGAALRADADLADQVTLWGKSCFEFVNKK